jgi:hypothetical protein
MDLSNTQKRQLAAELIRAAGDLIERWRYEGLPADRHHELVVLTVDEAAEQFSRWLTKLPGHEWDARLPAVN